jgi:hypothetical protein
VRHTEIDDEGCLCEDCKLKCEAYEAVVQCQRLLKWLPPSDVVVKLVVERCSRKVVTE